MERLEMLASSLIMVSKHLAHKSGFIITLQIIQGFFLIQTGSTVLCFAFPHFQFIMKCKP